jgi:hypothetical protein
MNAIVNNYRIFFDIYLAVVIIILILRSCKSLVDHEKNKHKHEDILCEDNYPSYSEDNFMSSSSSSESEDDDTDYISSSSDGESEEDNDDPDYIPSSSDSESDEEDNTDYTTSSSSDSESDDENNDPNYISSSSSSSSKMKLIVDKDGFDYAFYKTLISKYNISFSFDEFLTIKNTLLKVQHYVHWSFLTKEYNKYIDEEIQERHYIILDISNSSKNKLEKALIMLMYYEFFASYIGQEFLKEHTQFRKTFTKKFYEFASNKSYGHAFYRLYKRV